MVVHKKALWMSPAAQVCQGLAFWQWAQAVRECSGCKQPLVCHNFHACLPTQKAQTTKHQALPVELCRVKLTVL